MACPLVSSELLNYRTPVLLRIIGVIKGRLHELINADFHKTELLIQRNLRETMEVAMDR